jgi:hypothetical protein
MIFFFEDLNPISFKLNTRGKKKTAKTIHNSFEDGKLKKKKNT